MAKQGQQALLLSEGIGLSDVDPKKGGSTVLYTSRDGRGQSVPNTGQPCVMVDDQLAQTGGGLPSYIRLGKLTASDYLLQKGDTVTLTLPVTNEDTENHDFTVPWKEDGDQFAEETQTINDRSTNLYTQSVTKNNSGTFTYQGSQSNTVELTWLNVDPGPLKADPYVLKTTQTTTLSIDVTNPSPDPVDVKIEFFNGNDDKLKEATKTISANGGTQTYSLDQTFDFKATVDYYVRLTEQGTGLSGKSQTVTVKWTNARLLADWDGTGLREISAISVGGHSSWYGYDGSKATHGNFRNFGTAIQVNDDGSSVAISITHHDHSGPNTTGYPFTADTSFTFREGSHGGYIVQDEPEGGEPTGDSGQTAYTSSYMNHQFNGQNTDGAVIGLDPNTDITISISGDSTDGITFYNEDVLAGVSIRIVHNG